MSVLAPTYLNAVVDYLRGAGAPPSISALYLDLYNGNPATTGVSVLTTITGSATRSSVTSLLSAASGGVSQNPLEIVIAAESAGAATVSYVAFFDAATSGNLVMSNPLTVTRTVSPLDNVAFDADELVITLS